MEDAVEAACSDPASREQRIGFQHSLLLQLAELQLENERLREDNLQLRAALSIFSEVAKRSVGASS
jgi:hypothetical protein